MTCPEDASDTEDLVSRGGTWSGSGPDSLLHYVDLLLQVGSTIQTLEPKNSGTALKSLITSHIYALVITLMIVTFRNHLSTHVHRLNK